MAQPGSAPEWGSGGRQFKSGRPDHSGFDENGHSVKAGFFIRRIVYEAPGVAEWLT